MRRPLRLGIAAAVTVAAMAMVLVGTFQASVPFLAPSELTADLEGSRVQVEGIVEKMTVAEDHLLLELSDGAGTTAVARYAFAGQRPVALAEGRLVVAKGVYRDGVIQAHQVSVRAHEDPESN